MNEMSIESLMSVGTGLTTPKSVESKTFDISYDGYSDGLDMDLTRTSEQLHFVDTYDKLQALHSAEKMRMIKKIQTTYKNIGNTNVSNSVESYCNNAMSTEGIKEAFKKIIDTIISFFKKIIEQISNFFKWIVNFVKRAFSKLTFRIAMIKQKHDWKKSGMSKEEIKFAEEIALMCGDAAIDSGLFGLESYSQSLEDNFSTNNDQFKQSMVRIANENNPTSKTFSKSKQYVVDALTDKIRQNKKLFESTLESISNKKRHEIFDVFIITIYSNDPKKLADALRICGEVDTQSTMKITNNLLRIADIAKSNSITYEKKLKEIEPIINENSAYQKHVDDAMKKLNPEALLNQLDAKFNKDPSNFVRLLYADDFADTQTTFINVLNKGMTFKQTKMLDSLSKQLTKSMQDLSRLSSSGNSVQENRFLKELYNECKRVIEHINGIIIGSKSVNYYATKRMNLILDMQTLLMKGLGKI